VCGECAEGVGTKLANDDSSPRVRGTRAGKLARPSTSRFIPACAGNAVSARLVLELDSVHPRMCGERRELLGHNIEVTGSSPRVRGTHRPAGAHSSVGRFIPACAGNARTPAATSHRGPVHPRVCGERLKASSAWRALSGSSPRVRGTLTSGRGVCHHARFIPACAGNAILYKNSRRRRSVHPRVCGERYSLEKPAKIFDGSSPRVRGTRRDGVAGVGLDRFIPACAGNASSLRSTRPSTPVHPRVCGERIGSTPLASIICGSSPRVRGTPRW